MFDGMMRAQNRRVCLCLDNFSGHFTSYEPTNVELIFFKPNLTAWVQPLDAGIIRCLKAIFCKLVLYRSLDHEDEGEDDIFAINQLEAMQLLEEAWNGVKQLTIANCWQHTGILPSNDEEPSSSRAQASEPDVEFKVQEATNALQ